VLPPVLLPPVLRVALLHLAPRLGALQHNQDLLSEATQLAAAAGADWVLSGELVRTGYRFEPVIGLDWIEPQPDAWLAEYLELCAHVGVAAFVHSPDRDAETGQLFSSLIAIDQQGRVAGRHRKISVIPGSEDWTTRGSGADVVVVDGVRVGMLVCADAHPPGPTKHIVDAGADVIVSAAAWHPGAWGPAGEWEQRSRESALPLIVCNRTGIEASGSFLAAESVVAYRGERALTLAARDSTVFVIEMRRTPGGLAFQELERISL
jgi:predicted amidohydrolase